ncbi:B3 domain-containing protein Os01g0234100-like isoform X3 [Primulina huaijiensis]|uniref:B3 domain-containing protein Os01g0234100-like isoform X3 n=1 Tax=Primulina huaijiensis TaxID=1492673 RepID=UPI003CC786ED
MDSSKNLLVSSQNMWSLRSKKRLYEDEHVGFNHKKNKKKEEEKDRNFRRPVMCKGATVNSASCFCALARAKKVEANLSPEFPSCVKIVTQLQVPGGKEQYLVLPKKFCYEHLPIVNDAVVFVDENEKEFSVGYRFSNCRFRIGWKSFSNANRLLKGDVLVFHLIEHCKFKVYIVRSCRATKVDGAIQNPKKDALTVTENGDQIAEDARNCMGVKEEKQDLFWDDSDQEDITERLKFDHSPSPCCDNICSNVFGSIRFSASVLKFQDVKRFEDFKIYVDGLILDSELPVHAKMKYYELCCSRKMFLHDRMTGLSSKLVTGMISETSNIADAIQSTSLAASLHNLESWDNTLKAFEDLGMSVGFLRTRIDMLVKISRKYQTINESNSAKSVQVEEKKRALNEKVSSMDALRKSIAALEESIKSLEAEIDGEKEGLGSEFNKIATAPW